MRVAPVRGAHCPVDERTRKRGRSRESRDRPLVSVGRPGRSVAGPLVPTLAGSKARDGHSPGRGGRTSGFSSSQASTASASSPSSYWLTTRSSRRSEEHTSELQSRGQLVCRLLLEKKKIKQQTTA